MNLARDRPIVLRVLDEVMDVIDKASVTQRDIRDLIDLGHIALEGNKVVWLGDDYDVKAKYSGIMQRAKAGTLFYHRGVERFLSFFNEKIQGLQKVRCY
ncbi:hypothetical protein [Litoribacterium kuwaitense]|uniref:hypothetical protein n=1 Tax=Litoribacterium kuwaitense TaxID=1398745 RepID=UPI001BA56256|nr:hypothetical protein [Litoribacterium kuwaitense]